MAKTGTCWKIAQVKNEISNSKMNEDKLRFKKVPQNVVEKKREFQNTKKEQFLN